MAILLTAPASAFAEQARVEGVTYSPGRISVTIAHPDTGWDHYADAWEILDMNGDSLGIRELAHPHVNEQPFTRSLSLTLPGEAPWVVQVRARDSVHGWSDPITVTLD